MVNELLARLGYARGATQTLVSFVLEWTALVKKGQQRKTADQSTHNNHEFQKKRRTKHQRWFFVDSTASCTSECSDVCAAHVPGYFAAPSYRCTPADTCRQKCWLEGGVDCVDDVCRTGMCFCVCLFGFFACESNIRFTMLISMSAC
jgi:hypothetical protein